MDFALTDDEELLRDSARTLLRSECPTALVRAHIDEPAVADRLWSHLAEWTALGAGRLVELSLFAEEAGYVALPGPFLATVTLYEPLLAAAGLASGGEAGTAAVAGRAGHWVVNGDDVRRFVPEADRVERIAVVVAGPALAVVDAAPLDARLITTQDFSRRLFEVDVPAAVEGVALDPRALRDALDRAVVATAADLVGTSRRLLEMALDHSMSRVQFDRPIGAFQAIQHKLADMALGVERAASAVYYAAMAADADDPDRHRLASVAKAAAGEVATHCAKEAIQIHGGIGFTWEHDAHLFVRRAYGSEALLGTTAWHHDRLAEALFG